MGFGWFLSRRAFPLPFNPWHVFRICLATIVMGFVLVGLKLLLPTGVTSFCVIVACGGATYLAAAFVLDIAGIKSAVAPRLSNKLAVSGQVL
jgi:hypothetical protein